MGPEPASGTLIFLFTDVEGSTRLWERLPEAMKAALERHDRILRAADALERQVFRPDPPARPAP